MMVATTQPATPASSTASWPDLGDALDELRERRDASASLVPVVVLVWGVVAVLGQGETHEDDWALQDLIHEEDGADRPALAHEDGVPAEGELHGSLRSLDVGSSNDTLVRRGRRSRLDLDVRVPLLHEGLHELHHLLALHVRDETHGHLELGPWRHDRLDAGARVPAHETMDLERRHRPEPLHRVERVIRLDRLEIVGPLEARDAEARRLEALDLLRGELLDVVVESGNLHTAGAGVEDLRGDLRELSHRVARHAARRAGVLVGLGGLEAERDRLQPS